MILLLLLAAVTPATDTVRVKLTATIADAGSTTIGEISGLAIDAHGRIYVTDLQEPRILVFSEHGRLLTTIGRKGQGPGEFTAPTGPVFGPDGALYVRNMEQVQRFLPRAPGEVASRFDRGFAGPAMAPWRSKLPSAIDRAGRFYFPLQVGLADGLTHYAYRRYTLDGKYQDSIPVPVFPTSRSDWASAEIAPGTGRVIPGVNVVPFHPVPQWTITPAGTVLGGGADGPLLQETNERGVVVRKVSAGGVAVPIGKAERAESLAALNHRLDTLPVPLSRVRGMSEEVRQRRLPITYPWFRALLAGGSEAWLIRWSPPAQRGHTIIDVISLDGQVLRTLLLPAACQSIPAIAVRDKVVACMVVDDETGAETIAVMRLP
jgi:hypothetical protein